MLTGEVLYDLQEGGEVERPAHYLEYFVAAESRLERGGVKDKEEVTVVGEYAHVAFAREEVVNHTERGDDRKGLSCEGGIMRFELGKTAA